MDAPFLTFNELVFERARDPETSHRTMARMGDRSLTYGEYARASAEWAHLLLALRTDPARPPQVAVLMRNNLEFLLAYGGAALSGGTLFCINLGLGGDVLARVLDASGCDTVVVDDANRDALAAALPNVARIRPANVVHVRHDGTVEALDRLRAARGPALADPPSVPELTLQSPWIVVYTSGTTGLPKGILNSHAKLRGIGMLASSGTGMCKDDVGYLSMPLFHSNALYLNWLPAFSVGASVVLRDKFSASGFVEDILRYGCTFWNYVGQPVHYVLDAIARAHGGDEARIVREVAKHEGNRLRFCLGTGASGKERDKLVRWLGLEHVYEIYGSTEAEISTWCMPGDPLESVGEIRDDNVVVVGEDGRECPPVELDAAGNPTNYASAVGEIVKKGGLAGLFQGYHGMPDATAKKVAGGLYRSGDLGMVRRIGDKRYLYFVGRTDDWIRKDGENFSAESVVELVGDFDGVDLAAAYGVPHPVSDEWVMVALRMKPGHAFEPAEFFAHCERKVAAGRDRKWLPDLVRLVDDFEWTETHKIVVRKLKAAFYHPDRTDRVFARRRGDETFRPFDRAAWDELRREFEATGRQGLLAV